MKKLILFIILTSNLIYASTPKETKQQILEQINKRIDGVYYYKDSNETKTINSKAYIFTFATAFGYIKDDNVNEYNVSCFAIATLSEFLGAFCDYAELAKFDFKDSYFTFYAWRLYRGGGGTNFYYTFKLIDDKVYLHQYSQELLKANPNDEYGEDLIVDKTLIYYRQPRDDAKMANLIPLDSINDELLEKLQDECEKSGKCN